MNRTIGPDLAPRNSTPAFFPPQQIEKPCGCGRRALGSAGNARTRRALCHKAEADSATMTTKEIDSEVKRIERGIKEREREIGELKATLRDLWTERAANRLRYGHRTHSARAA